MAQYNILLLQTAEIELNESYEWYEKQKAGLGNNFIGAISSCLNSIADNPYKYAKRYSYQLRFAPVSVFPFIIVYRPVKEDRVIHIISIFHTSRNPKKFFS